MSNLDKLTRALAELKKGKFLVVYDGAKREGEADLVFHCGFATPSKTYALRKDAGGMIVLAIGKEIASELNLPFIQQLFSKAGIENVYVKTNYNDLPPYTTPVNHVNAHTGVTDNDKALAIKDFSRVFAKNDKRGFYNSRFRTPGHLPICVSRGIENRHGHTELAVELARRAKLSQAMVLCEMLGKGKALSKKQARNYAKKNGLVFLEGSDIYGK